MHTFCWKRNDQTDDFAWSKSFTLSHRLWRKFQNLFWTSWFQWTARWNEFYSLQWKRYESIVISRFEKIFFLLWADQNSPILVRYAVLRQWVKIVSKLRTRWWLITFLLTPTLSVWPLSGSTCFFFTMHNVIWLSFGKVESHSSQTLPGRITFDYICWFMRIAIV